MTNIKTDKSPDEIMPQNDASGKNDTPNKDASVKPARRIPRLVFIGGGALFLTIAIIAAYFANFRHDRGQTQELAASPCSKQTEAKIAKLKPLATGAMSGWKFPEHSSSLSKLTFMGPDNQKIGLAAFAGRTVLLNLWASWCAPCREEMPSLNKLQALQGSSTFSVVALNAETFRPERGKAFLAQLGANSLLFYSDPSGEAMATLKQQGAALTGLPVTLLIDGDGCELASLAGPANWAAEEATAFLQVAQ